MNSEQIIKGQIDAYRENFLTHKDSALGTHWNNRETQYLRFERILKPFLEILNEQVTLHDFGCGACDLYDYLQQQNIVANYSGTEVVQEMIDHAKSKFPGVTLFNRDILKSSPPDNYQIVVLSGVLNLPGAATEGEWREFAFRVVDTLFGMCTTALSFNFLTTYSTFQNANLFYMDPREMLDYCIKKHSRFVSLDQSYPMYEWTMTVWHPDYIKAKYPQPEFKKYFTQK